MTGPTSVPVLALAALAVMASATPTTAQEPLPAAAAVADDDWDFGEDASRRLTIAAVTFENFGVAVRCMDGAFSLILSGLPEATGERTIRYEIGDEEAESFWVSARNSTSAFAIRPNRLAQLMGRGGSLTLSISDDGQDRRIVADLPPSAQAVARVFEACGRPMPEDTSRSRAEAEAAEAMPGLVWRSMPQVNFPVRAIPTSGLAGLTCQVKSDGSLRGCTAESEFPVGSGFGRAAELGAHQSGRVGLADGSRGLITERSIAFIVRYAMAPDAF